MARELTDMVKDLQGQVSESVREITSYVYDKGQLDALTSILEHDDESWNSRRDLIEFIKYKRGQILKRLNPND